MRARIALVLLITAACLAWVLAGIDRAAVQQALASARWAYVLPAWLAFALCHGVRTLRIRALVGQPLPLGQLYAINGVGFLAINVVPLRLGELVRPYLLSKLQGVPFGAAMAAIFLERLLDMLALLVLLLWVAAFVELPPQGVMVGGLDIVTAGQRFAAVFLGGGLAFIAALLVVGGPLIDRVVSLIPSPGLAERLGGFLRAFHAGLGGLLREPARAVQVVLATAALWAGTIGAVLLVMLAFEGIPHSYRAATAMWTTTITGMTVAPTPGFFGAYEAFCLAGLLLWDVERSLGATFAVVLHLVQFGFTVILGSTSLIAEGLSLRQVVQDSRASISAAP